VIQNIPGAVENILNRPRHDKRIRTPGIKTREPEKLAGSTWGKIERLATTKKLGGPCKLTWKPVGKGRSSATKQPETKNYYDVAGQTINRTEIALRSNPGANSESCESGEERHKLQIRRRETLKRL